MPRYQGFTFALQNLVRKNVAHENSVPLEQIKNKITSIEVEPKVVIFSGE